MKDTIIMVFTTILLSSCSTRQKDEHSTSANEAKSKVTFESARWREKEDMDYPYRESMVDDLIASKQLKKLKHDKILDLLGQPDRDDSLYMFYTIVQDRISVLPIHTKTLVIKLKEDSTLQWVKIHE